MPISFVLVGLILIYTFFYKKDFKFRNVFIGLLLIILVGYFVSEINILNGVLINVLIFLPLFLINIYTILNLKRLDSILFVVAFFVTNTIYILLVIFNMEFATVFNPRLIFLLTIIFAVFLSYSVNLALSYSMSVYIMFDVLNVLLVKNNTSVVSIMSVDTFSLVMYLIFISLIANKIILFLKSKLIKEKRINA